MESNIVVLFFLFFILILCIGMFMSDRKVNSTYRQSSFKQKSACYENPKNNPICKEGYKLIMPPTDVITTWACGLDCEGGQGVGIECQCACQTEEKCLEMDRASCKGGSKWDETLKKCTCPGGSKWNRKLQKCVCESGKIYGINYIDSFLGGFNQSEEVSENSFSQNKSECIPCYKNLFTDPLCYATLGNVLNTMLNKKLITDPNVIGHFLRKNKPLLNTIRVDKSLDYCKVADLTIACKPFLFTGYNAMDVPVNNDIKWLNVNNVVFNPSNMSIKIRTTLNCMILCYLIIAIKHWCVDCPTPFNEFGCRAAIGAAKVFHITQGFLNNNLGLGMNEQQYDILKNNGYQTILNLSVSLVCEFNIDFSDFSNPKITVGYPTTDHPFITSIKIIPGSSISTEVVSYALSGRRGHVGTESRSYSDASGFSDLNNNIKSKSDEIEKQFKTQLTNIVNGLHLNLASMMHG